MIRVTSGYDMRCSALACVDVLTLIHHRCALCTYVWSVDAGNDARMDDA